MPPICQLRNNFNFFLFFCLCIGLQITSIYKCLQSGISETNSTCTTSCRQIFLGVLVCKSLQSASSDVNSIYLVDISFFFSWCANHFNLQITLNCKGLQFPSSGIASTMLIQHVDISFIFCRGSTQTIWSHSKRAGTQIEFVVLFAYFRFCTSSFPL